jgi:hypothetical protein
VIDKESRIGTPEETSVPRVREKRAIAALRMSDAEDREAEQHLVDQQTAAFGAIGLSMPMTP